MADFILTAIETVEAALRASTPAALRQCDPPRQPFVAFRRAWTGESKVWPAVWVMPSTTEFAPEGNPEEQGHDLIVRIGITGSDPETLVAMAIDYVRVVDAALRAATLEGTVLRVYVRAHDYGPVHGGNTGFGIFPDVHVRVTTVEVL